MNPRTHIQKRMLKVVAGLLIAGSVVCVVVALAMPPAVAVPENSESRKASRINIEASLLPLDHYEAIYAKDVRRPLYDPPPVVVPPPVVALSGTTILPYASVALVPVVCQCSAGS